MYFSFASVTNGLGPLDHLPCWFQIEILFIRQFTWCMSKLRIVVSTVLCKVGTWWAIASGGDKGCIGLYTKLCDFTLLFMILQAELRLNKDH